MTDYSGNIHNMETFSDTTDGSGEITVSLSHTPIDDSTIVAFTHTAKRVVEFVSRTGTSVTLKFRKLVYDRTDTGVGGTVNNVPSGVSISDASTISTSVVGSSYGDSSTGGASTNAHSHTIAAIFDHDHSYTETDLPLAASEVVSVAVIYAESP